MRGLAISILISALILSVLAVVSVSFITNQIRSTSSQAKNAGATNSETSNPTQLATDVKSQVDLKNIQTSLIVYFSEFGYYPFDLNELVSANYIDMDLNNFSYQRCDADTVIVKASNGGFKLEGERLSTDLTC